jgi:hypothetical protein
MWSQILLTLLGLWLMIAPALFDFSKRISDNAHITGPLIASFSIIAIWECTRNVRFLNVPLAAWMLVAPWILHYQNTTATVNDCTVAALIIILSFVKPKRKYRFGGGWPAVWKDNTLHSKEAQRL